MVAVPISAFNGGSSGLMIFVTRSRALRRIQLVTLRAACGWNTDEVLAEYNRAIGGDDFDDETA